MKASGVCSLFNDIVDVFAVVLRFHPCLPEQPVTLTSTTAERFFSFFLLTQEHIVLDRTVYTTRSKVKEGPWKTPDLY